MLFAEEFGPISTIATMLGVIGTIGGGIGWLLTFLRKNRKDDDESTIGHFKTLLEREKKECDEALAEMRGRLSAMENRLDAQMREQFILRDKLADALARVRYMEHKCRDAGMKLEPWELASDSTIHQSLGGKS